MKKLWFCVNLGGVTYGLGEAVNLPPKLTQKRKKAKSLSLSQNATYPAKYQTTSMMKVNFSLSFTFISGSPLKRNAVTMHGQHRDDAWPEP